MEITVGWSKLYFQNGILTFVMRGSEDEGGVSKSHPLKVICKKKNTLHINTADLDNGDLKASKCHTMQFFLQLVSQRWKKFIADMFKTC